MRTGILLFFALFVATTTLSAQQRNCSAMDVLDREIQQDPSRLQRLQEIEAFTQSYHQRSENEKALSGGILTIPVIVHVVYNNSTENISDQQINSQIAVLNDDFRRLNADRNNTPADFQPFAADSEIEFCLTQVVRVPTSVSSFGTNNSVKFASSGGSDVIDPANYLNIWVCDIGGGILGYAQFPGGSASTDGVVNDYRYFGTTGTATAPFNKGRTMTHEVGHYLNLRHIWGDGGCSVDDFVADTPAAGGPNYTGGACTYPGPNSCQPRGRNKNDPDFADMFQNYMDYSDDGCMNLFTSGQKDRMWAAIQASRPGLLTSTCDGTPPPPPPAEICDNGIDDDGDGLTDCADPDCGGDPVCDNNPPSGNCDAPTGLTGSSKKRGRELQLSWNAVSGAVSYDLELYVGGQQVYSGNLTGTALTLTGSTRGTTYDWQVRANCGSNGLSPWATSSVTARSAARTAGAELAQEISLVPNPTYGNQLVLNWDLSPAAITASGLQAREITNAEVTVRILTMTGRELNSRRILEDLGTTTIDLNELSAGVYLVQVVGAEGRVATTKLVKL